MLNIYDFTEYEYFSFDYVLKKQNYAVTFLIRR